MTKLYSIFLNLENRRCAVIGGGNIALKKARKLSECGCLLRIVSLDFCDEIISEFLPPHEILKKAYESSDLKDCFIAISATNNAVLNAQVSEDCRKLKIPVNAVDQPSDCDFFVPAIVDKGSIQIAISTGGESPAMAGWIKRQIDQMINPRITAGLEIISTARKELIEKHPGEFDSRAKSFRAFFDSDIWHGYLAGQSDLTREVVVEWISSYSE